MGAFELISKHEQNKKGMFSEDLLLILRFEILFGLKNQRYPDAGSSWVPMNCGVNNRV